MIEHKKVLNIFLIKFSSQEIERLYNLIKMLLAGLEKFIDAINSMKRDIAGMPKELKKTCRRKYYLMNEK